MGMRGPKRSKLSKTQQLEFVDLIEKGYGRAHACRQIGISICTMYARMKDDEGFRELVTTAEKSRSDEYMKKVYELKDHPDPKIMLDGAKVWFSQCGKIEDSRIAQAERKRQRALASSSGPMSQDHIGDIVKLFEKHLPPEKLPAVLEDLSKMTAGTFGEPEFVRKPHPELDGTEQEDD